ncbi:SLOG family protein [Brevibacterium oceani]|uniref:SLOG family protein n=1 Tax=Brevibacterium oceani TaxID=358099 RepID=UPI0015E7CD4F|nr:SLOG family protein [Brevibacterium oceani]
MPIDQVSHVSHALLITGSRTWDDEPTMRRAFNDIWSAWRRTPITNPVLISGHARDGADAMAERLWRAAGFDVIEVPADWSARGRKAGLERNLAMVDLASRMRDRGTAVACAAFLDPCAKPGCSRRRHEQLAPAVAGHFSHGTVHCRDSALSAGLSVVDVLR